MHTGTSASRAICNVAFTALHFLTEKELSYRWQQGKPLKIRGDRFNMLNSLTDGLGAAKYPVMPLSIQP